MRLRWGRLGLLSACCLSLLLLGGCARDQADGTRAGAVDTTRVSGSGTCRPLVEMLTDAYEAQDKGVAFSYLPGLHSGGGIRGVANGDLDIGMVSRELTDEEKRLGLRYTPLSSDGLIIAAHRDVAVRGLTTAQVKAIYAGEVTNWSEVGGPDLAITVLDRNEDESAKIILREYVIGDLKVTPRAVNLFYEQDMVDGLEKTPGAIGYFSLGYALSRDVPVRRLKLDGIDGTVANIRNGSYRVIRPLGVVTEQRAPASVSGFLKWATSKQAMELIESKGYAPPIDSR